MEEGEASSRQYGTSAVRFSIKSTGESSSEPSRAEQAGDSMTPSVCRLGVVSVLFQYSRAKVVKVDDFTHRTGRPHSLQRNFPSM